MSRNAAPPWPRSWPAGWFAYYYRATHPPRRPLHSSIDNRNPLNRKTL